MTETKEKTTVPVKYQILTEEQAQHEYIMGLVNQFCYGPLDETLPSTFDVPLDKYFNMNFGARLANGGCWIDG